MFFLYILRFIKGHIILTINGSNTERLINLLTKNNIPFLDLHIEPDGTKLITMTPHSFKQLYKLTHQYSKPVHSQRRRKSRYLPNNRRPMSCIKLHIIKKSGLPFYIRKYKKRLGIPVGIAVFFLILTFLSSMLWSINISGNTAVSSQDIWTNLNNSGIKPCSFKRSIDVNICSEALQIALPDLSWVAINIKGSTAEVKVREKIYGIGFVDESTPANIISSCDGQIVEMNVFKGKAVVKSGQAVRKGQLLVSGTVEMRDLSTHFVHASAEIKAICRTTIVKNQPFKNTIKVLTGNTKEIKRISCGNLSFNLSLNSSIPYEKYGIITRRREFSLPFINAIVCETAEYHEMITEEMPFSRDGAIKEAMRLIEEDLLLLGRANVLTAEYGIEENAIGVTVSAFVEYITDIGMDAELQIIEHN